LQAGNRPGNPFVLSGIASKLPKLELLFSGSGAGGDNVLFDAGKILMQPVAYLRGDVLGRG
jgi:hypothetical protein